MAAQREAERRVVADDLLAFGRRRAAAALPRGSARPCSSAGARRCAVASQTCWRRWPDRRQQRIGGGQRVHVLAVEFGAQGQVFGAGERRPAARAATMRLRAGLAQAADAGAGPGARRAGDRPPDAGHRMRLRACSPSRCTRDIDRPHLDAMAPRVLHQLRGRVEAHGLRVEQRGQEARGLVALEPAARRRPAARSWRHGFRGSRIRRSPGSA